MKTETVALVVNRKKIHWPVARTNTTVFENCCFITTLSYFIFFWSLQALFVGINDKDLKWIASDLVRLCYFMFCFYKLFLDRFPDIQDILKTILLHRS